MKNVNVQRGERMRSFRRSAYMVLGWGTWNAWKSAIRHKMKGQLKRGVVIGAGLFAVAIIGAVIANKNGS